MTDYLAIAKQFLADPASTATRKKAEKNSGTEDTELVQPVDQFIGADQSHPSPHSGGSDHLGYEKNELNEGSRGGFGLKNLAVELWCDSLAGTVWIVGDEEDAKLAMDRLCVTRGQVWVPAEIQLVATIRDREVALELVRWKQKFAGSLSTGQRSK